MDDVEFERWHRAIQRAIACREHKARRLAARVGEGVVLVMRRRGASSVGAFVHPASEAPGRWRISYFDRFGFSGDTIRDTPEEAFDLCLREQYRDTNRNLLREYASHPEFFATLPARAAP